MSLFRSAFKHYQEGTASEEERLLVEEELEKNELINEYLSEEIVHTLAEQPASIEHPEAAGSAISRAVNRKLRGIIFFTVLLIALLILACVFVVYPAYDRSFYNPNRGYVNSQGESVQLLADMAAFTELHFPGTITMGADAISTGFGTYEIQVNQETTLHSREIYTDRLVRGRAANPSNLWNFPPSNLFYDRGGARISIYEDGVLKDEKQNTETFHAFLQDLRELPASSQASAAFSFPTDCTMEELSKLIERNNLQFCWAAIRYTDEKYFTTQLGMEPFGNGIVIDSVPAETYPNFELADTERTPQDLETHFKTLLRYLADRKDFLNAFADVNNLDPQFYLDALDYVEKNGVKTYGVVVQGDADEILSFAEKEELNSIMLLDAKLAWFAK